MEDKLARLLLKKITKEIATGQSVLHVSNKQKQITEKLSANNSYIKASSLEDLASLNLTKTNKAFTYVIADMDNPCLDDFDKFLHRIAPMIIRPGLLIIVATNLSTTYNKIALFFGNDLENSMRPLRSVTPGYLRKHLLENGYFVKNRFWQYGTKLLIMADIPVRY